MSRRTRPEKRPVLPDLKYNNKHVSMFVNRLMYSGKKSTAYGVMYKSFDMMEDRAKSNPVDMFEQAIKNTTPRIEVKAQRVGGTTYQVPTEVTSARQLALSMRWLLAAARKRSGRTMAEKLANEFMDASKGQGAAVKKKDDTHRMADANRAFAHFARYRSGGR